MQLTGESLIPRTIKKPPLSPHELALKAGIPGRFKFVDGQGNVIWQAQEGMQQKLFELSGNRQSRATEILLGGLRGPGKGSTLDSPVCTPHGMKPMRDIRVGSLVSNPDGGVAKVIAVFPQGEKDIYRFTFSDGATTKVTDDHLWLAKRTCRHLKGSRRYCPFGEEDEVPYKIWTTKYLKQYLDENADRTWETGQSNILIPLTEPVEFTSSHWHRWSSEYAVDGYALGLLLGDGCLRGNIVKFTSVDEELAGELKARTGLELKCDRGKDYRALQCGDYVAKLRKIGVFGKLAHEKSVPEIYKVAPASVRREVLQGLMDTDGTVDYRAGWCSFTSTSRQLAEDVQYLARSLGYKATLTESRSGYRKVGGEYVECRDSFDIYIQGQNTRDLFRLKRKRDLCRDEFNGGTTVPHRRIENIEYCGKEEAQCIAVDHPNQLYLTDGFIVTHNTDALIAWMAEPTQNADYRGIVLRFSGEALKEWIDRSWQIYKLMGARMKNRPVEFHFPSGAIVYTGHLRDERSFEDYKGHEYHRIGIEEATQIAKKELYLKLLGSNRSTVPGIVAQVCSTTNPDGPGNDWLKRRFVKVYPMRGNMLPWGERFEDPITKRIRVYIPGSITENKVLLDNDPTYYDRLRDNSPQLVKAWVEGDWDAPASQFYPEFRANGPVILGDGIKEPPEANHVVPAHPIAPWLHRWISLDYGWAHHAAAYWYANSTDSRIHVYREHVVRKLSADLMGAEIAKRTTGELERYPSGTISLYLSHECFGSRVFRTPEQSRFRSVLSRFWVRKARSSWIGPTKNGNYGRTIRT